MQAAAMAYAAYAVDSDPEDHTGIYPAHDPLRQRLASGSYKEVRASALAKLSSELEHALGKLGSVVHDSPEQLGRKLPNSSLQLLGKADRRWSSSAPSEDGGDRFSSFAATTDTPPASRSNSRRSSAALQTSEDCDDGDHFSTAASSSTAPASACNSRRNSAAQHPSEDSDGSSSGWPATPRADGALDVSGVSDRVKLEAVEAQLSGTPTSATSLPSLRPASASSLQALNRGPSDGLSLQRHLDVPVGQSPACAPCGRVLGSALRPACAKAGWHKVVRFPD